MLLVCQFFNITSTGNITGPFGPSLWYEANDICEQQGSKLLTTDSQEEENYVAGSINPTSQYVNEQL